MAFWAVKEYPPITESSQQKFAWVYAEIRHTISNYKNTTGPQLPIVISNQYTVTSKDKFHTLQKISKTHTIDHVYGNFVITHIEVATDHIKSHM